MTAGERAKELVDKEAEWLELRIRRAIESAVAEERERCADLVLRLYGEGDGWREHAAAAIREERKTTRSCR